MSRTAATPAPVRVLYVRHGFRLGGAERSILNLARHGPEHGLVSGLAVIGRSSVDWRQTQLAEVAELGVPVTVFPRTARSLRHPQHLLEATSGVRRLARRLRADIVDTSGASASLVGRLACVGTRTFHVTEMESSRGDARAPSSTPWRLARWFYRRSYSLTAGFVAVSATLLDEDLLGGVLPADRITVIPRGVDLEEFPAQPLPAPSLDDGLRLLSVGRLVPSKDHLTAIRAVGLLRARGGNASLTIAGAGPLRADLDREIGALGLGGCVKLKGPWRDVAGLHREHDAFVFPTRFEALPLAALEAMASARPVVVSDIPSLRAIAGDTGIYFPPGDAEALAMSLDRLLRTPIARRRRIGLEARARVESAFDARRQVGALVDYYRSLTSR